MTPKPKPAALIRHENEMADSLAKLSAELRAKAAKRKAEETESPDEGEREHKE